MRSVLDAFRELPVPSEGLFSVESHPLHSEMLLGKDSAGAPAVIYSGKILHDGAIPVRLRNVLLLPRARIEVRRGDVTSVVEAAVYHCRAESLPLREYFIVAVASILSSQLRAGRFDAGGVLRQLAELFHHLEAPGRATVQGLWGELFVLCESSDPETMLEAWHGDPYEHFDFARGADRLEVKTCGSEDRQHHFSLAQARPATPIQAHIASLVCARSVGGVSIQELAEKLRGLAKNPIHALKLEMLLLEALGDALVDSSDMRFDLQRARASLRFFPAETIPSVSAELPPGVRNVHFEARLTEALALPLNGVPEQGSLLASAWPAAWV